MLRTKPDSIELVDGKYRTPWGNTAYMGMVGDHHVFLTTGPGKTTVAVRDCDLGDVEHELTLMCEFAECAPRGCPLQGLTDGLREETLTLWRLKHGAPADDPFETFMRAAVGDEIGFGKPDS